VLPKSEWPYPGATKNGSPPSDAEWERALAEMFRRETLGQLTSEIAHRYSDAITVILGYCDLLKLLKPSDLPWLTYLENMRDAVDRASELTRQLLGFCGQTSESRIGPVDLAAVVKTAAGMLNGLLKRRIELKIDPTREAHIRADGGDVELLVVNLVLYACEATTAQDTCVEVSVCPVFVADALGSVPPGDYSRLRVCDTGCAVHEVAGGRLFTTRRGGAGLRRAVVEWFVQRNRAAMTEQTDPANGTTFDVYFPAAG
jgi:two-component system cell cycle sensor histidine kinase/response regulator CckA